MKNEKNSNEKKVLKAIQTLISEKTNSFLQQHLY